MKTTLMIFALAFGMVSFASAQQRAGNRQGGGRMQANSEERVKQLDDKLKLSEEQKLKAQIVYAEAIELQKKMREEMMAGGGDRQAMMEKMQKMNADVDSKINAFLTDEQKKAYKAWQDQVKADRQKMMAERLNRN
jgi:exoribonuclease R